MEAKEALQAAVDALKLSYRAYFVPFSKSRNAKKNAKPSDYSLNWHVSIANGSRTLTTDYQQGIAHIPGYQQRMSGRMSVDEFDSIKRACETGKAGGRDSNLGIYLGAKPIPAPELRDVLHSLVLDAGALDYASFEDWAADFGYDTDSREAERIYKACVKIGLELRALIGDAGIASLREAAQDY